MKINFYVRFKNKTFWIAMIPALIITAQHIAATFGFYIDLSTFENHLIDVVKDIFCILALLGIVVDPTTDGIGDSKRALSYSEPYAEDRK